MSSTRRGRRALWTAWEAQLRSLSTADLRDQLLALRPHDDPIQALAATRWRIVLDELLRRGHDEAVRS